MSAATAGSPSATADSEQTPSSNSTQAVASSHIPAVLAPTAGIVKDHIYITDGGELRTIAVSATLPPSMHRSSGWCVEDFDLHKELYRGKTSLLYSATDRRSGIPVALKLYRKRKLSTLNKYQVEREVRIHIQLDHVNIIKLFAAFEDEKNVYMVQEFAGGGDLFEDLKRNGGTIKEKYTVRDIIVPFLNALQYLHGLGIIHRDIKPENILLTSDRVIKIADFGLSICYTQERPVTRAGTLDYMAPEVLICPDKRRPEENKDKVLLAYTAQVDAWAVGILCYELLVGYPPFEQESRAATYEHIMYKEPKFPTWMTDDARHFIAAALCKNATQRPTITDLGSQPLILTYAKPVEKSLESRLPQEFLVERSTRSVAMVPPAPMVMLASDAAPLAPPTPQQHQPQPHASPSQLSGHVAAAHLHAPGVHSASHSPLHHLAVPQSPHVAVTTSISSSAVGLGGGGGGGQPVSPTSSAAAPVGIKRPGLLETSMDDSFSMTGSADSPTNSSGSPTKEGKLISKKSSNAKRDASGMVLDEDASYPISDFAVAGAQLDDASFLSINGSTHSSTLPRSGTGAPSPLQLPIARTGSTGIRSAPSPLAKSRLSGLSQGGAHPTGLSLPQGKVSPLVRTSALSSQPGTASGPTSGGQHGFAPHPPSGTSSSGVDPNASFVSETSSGAYYKPQSGILSDDSHVPRTNSITGGGSVSGAAAVRTGLSSNGVAPAAGTGPASSGLRAGGVMERPNLEKLLATPAMEEATPSHEHDSGASRYSKLFAKMWGGKDKAAPVRPESPTSASRLGSGLRLHKGGSVRALQEELLAERADSIVQVDGRTGSVIGAPTMTYKKPSPAAVQARNAVEAAAAAAATTASMPQATSSAPGTAMVGPASVGVSAVSGEKLDRIRDTKSTGVQRLALTDDSGPQRLNSEALMARLGTGAANMGRSFTSANSPTMKKLANAPIVNKIHEYVAQNHHTASDSKDEGA